MRKGSFILFCLVALLMHCPCAEAGILKRTGLRTFKWGVLMPARYISYGLAAPWAKLLYHVEYTLVDVDAYIDVDRYADETWGEHAERNAKKLKESENQ